MTPNAVYVIDDVEVPRVVFDAFRASLSDKLVDKEGAAYTAQDQGERHVLRRKVPVKPVANATQYAINRLAVSKAVYNAFRATLKEEPGSWFCAEMTDGGSTGMHATSSDGKRYAVREVSSTKRGDRHSITQLDSSKPGNVD